MRRPPIALTAIRGLFVGLCEGFPHPAGRSGGLVEEGQGVLELEGGDQVVEFAEARTEQLLQRFGMEAHPLLNAHVAVFQFTPDFLRIAPNNRIPAIVDQAPADGGEPISIFESGAILLYLAEKTGKLLPKDPAARYETIQWVFFQMAAIGPMFGQLGFFLRWGGKDYEDKRPQQRFADESKRLLGILDRQLDGREWIVDDYSIADIATLGWVNALTGMYDASELVGVDAYSNVQIWLERGLARPAVQRGLNIPARPA